MLLEMTPTLVSVNITLQIDRHSDRTLPVDIQRPCGLLLMIISNDLLAVRSVSVRITWPTLLPAGFLLRFLVGGSLGLSY